RGQFLRLLLGERGHRHFNSLTIRKARLLFQFNDLAVDHSLTGCHTAPPLQTSRSLNHKRQRQVRYKSFHNSEPPFDFFFGFCRVAADVVLRGRRFVAVTSSTASICVPSASSTAGPSSRVRLRKYSLIGTSPNGR